MLTRLSRENDEIAPQEILRCTRKLLDRVLFCAFCEDRSLLPADTLKHTFTHHDPYNPKPIWETFRGLFRAIDTGNTGLNIPAYNGGLFAADPGLNPLAVPDDVCAHFRDLADYDYRPAREVADEDEETEVRSVIDVDILGHIFEQSITDLERLRHSLESGGVPMDDGQAILGQALHAADSDGRRSDLVMARPRFSLGFFPKTQVLCDFLRRHQHPFHPQKMSVASLDSPSPQAFNCLMNATLSSDGQIVIPAELRESAQLKPGDTLDVQLYKGTIVMRKHQPLTAEQCAELLERSRTQSKLTPEDDAAVEQAI